MATAICAFARRPSGPSIAVLVCAVVVAQSYGGEPRAIRWKSPAAQPARPDRDGRPVDTLGRTRHALVQFCRQPDVGARAQLAAAGVRLLTSVGGRAYFAALPAGHTGDDLSGHEPHGCRVVPIQREWKLHPSLVTGDPPAWAIVDSASAETQDAVGPWIAVCVVLHADVQLETEGARACLRHGARVRSALWPINALVVELPVAEVPLLADEDVVQWIEPPLPVLGETNNDNRARTGAETVQQAPYDLDGTGVNVLVYDSGTAQASHPDFGGRLTRRDTTPVKTHASHVAGTIGGSGSSSGGTYRGMAPGVTLESYGFEMAGGPQAGFLYTDPGDLQDDYDEAINTYGVVLANNSIGSNVETNGFDCAWQGDYGTTASLIDAIVGGSLGAPICVVWSVGNERYGDRCDVEGFGDYYSIAPPACAKNAIVVGGLNSNDDSMVDTTSWGPTDDGRLKPDLTAPGCQGDGDFGVTSCNSSGGYTSMCSSSMATATVTGLVALLLEHFRQQYPAQPDPLNSTIKALLAQTAVDEVALDDNRGPDYRYGFGSVRIQRAIDLVRAGAFVEGVLDANDVFGVDVLVGAADAELRVTLAWDDVPGTPNVSPALVNDLDLSVFDESQIEHLPWTLDPNDPGAPAVRTQRDRLNNVEQVVIDNPTAGVYRIEVRGFNVAQGPQTFSLCSSASLLICTSRGTLSLDRPQYACQSTAALCVVDCDLNTDDQAVETATITIASDSEPAGESVLLTETAADSAAFLGSIPLDEVDAGGVLWIAPGDTITATYIDADDGQGGTDVTVEATAVVECTPPQISNVAVSDVGPRRATVSFETDEPTIATVHYDIQCGPLTNAQSGSGYATMHAVQLADLDPNTSYFFEVAAEDAAGNTSTLDDGGQCFSFTTPAAAEVFFTEQFTDDFDLDGYVLVFVPDASPNGYTLCADLIDALPTDPNGETVISLGEDQSEQVLLPGVSVLLFGQSYETFYVGSNGYLTFDGPDVTHIESLAAHFAQPRVAALFDDLSPLNSTVSWNQREDHVAVTWYNVPEYNKTNSNTFQIELYYDGRIQIAWLGVAARDAIVGLSAGGGLPEDFEQMDLSAAAACGARPPVAEDMSVAVTEQWEQTIVLSADDDGLPDPPASLQYVITSLPRYDLRDAGDDHVITAEDLPYTLVDDGSAVIYGRYNPLVHNRETFQFHVDDGGAPPSGGASSTATVTLTVGEMQPICVFPLDGDPNWACEGQWAFGRPAGGGSFGGDPDGGHTGDYAYGYNLYGDYENDMSAAYLTSAVFDCTNQTVVELRFWRWLGVEAATFDSASIEVSAGGSWVTAWSHTGESLSETEWSGQVIDISAIAEMQSAVSVRWAMGPTDQINVYPGWNIDDIEIWGVPIVPGDVNCSGELGFDDVNPFVYIMLSLELYYTHYPDCNHYFADVNLDGEVGFGDINSFIEALINL